MIHSSLQVLQSTKYLPLQRKQGSHLRFDRYYTQNTWRLQLITWPRVDFYVDQIDLNDQSGKFNLIIYIYIFYNAEMQGWLSKLNGILIALQDLIYFLLEYFVQEVILHFAQLPPVCVFCQDSSSGLPGSLLKTKTSF